jgi:cytochrome c-type biogenesis protein CcmF
MRIAGELCLLTALVASGFAAFACIAGERAGSAKVSRAGLLAAVLSFVTLSVCMGVLAWSLLAKDFSFDYVANYASRELPAHYSLSALWVGQAGSLLLWAWMTNALVLVFRFAQRKPSKALRDVATGLGSGYVSFLVAIMVFAADPMKVNIAATEEGAGLSPLLQHPAMMIHPPIVFAGYAASTLLFALAIAALMIRQLNLEFVNTARPWAIITWALLGCGILLGANWAYEELGWGGYWGWDPVENGSLMPWLTCTVLIHSLMVWRHCDGWKRMALALAMATFGLCNFATFLTRSGIFSSLHAFSQSPIGWMFLVLMVLLVAVGGGLIYWRRRLLVSTMKLSSLWARETHAVIAGAALLLLTGVVFVGTVLVPVSTHVAGVQAVVGPPFYNAVLAPIGLLLLSTTVAVPLLRWGAPPSAAARKLLGLSVGAGAVVAVAGMVWGIRRPEALIVVVLAVAAPVTLASALVLEVRRIAAQGLFTGLIYALQQNRRSFAGYTVHLGFVAFAIGVAGSGLGSQRHDVVMNEGESLDWAGRRIRYTRLIQTELADKLVAEAELEICEGDGEKSYVLRPARHFHVLQEQWTTEVDIGSSWSGDLYTILNNGEGGTAVSLTFIEMPLMRWLWLGGGVSGLGVVISLWPARRKRRAGQQAIVRLAEARSTLQGREHTAPSRRKRAA